ncbi:MAG TPA: DUF881 domain-containing protein [Acidimicrobiales bacterium]|nr:DUF881 domain-containing protein [Acidimicrobiales bacterium]
MARRGTTPGPRRGARRRRWVPAVGAGLLALLAVFAYRGRPASPQLRLPRQYQLAALIERDQGLLGSLRDQLAQLQSQSDAANRAALGRRRDLDTLSSQLRSAMAQAGLTPVRGSGLRAVLDDAAAPPTTTADINNFVIHSQDVQAVVNALWRAGAEAVAVNGQRVVSTSAVLCVGNTLLLDGTVSSPPYVAVGVGADQGRFEADPLVRQLHADASVYGLRFDVSSGDGLTAPAFAGAVQPRYAQSSAAPAPAGR